jgi:hypothetical protein
MSQRVCFLIKKNHPVQLYIYVCVCNIKVCSPLSLVTPAIVGHTFIYRRTNRTPTQDPRRTRFIPHPAFIRFAEGYQWTQYYDNHSNMSATAATAAAAEDAASSAANGPYLLHWDGGNTVFPRGWSDFNGLSGAYTVCKAYDILRTRRVRLKKKIKYIKRKRTLYIHTYTERERKRESVIYTETPAEIVNITVPFRTWNRCFGVLYLQRRMNIILLVRILRILSRITRQTRMRLHYTNCKRTEAMEFHVFFFFRNLTWKKNELTTKN